eukprot:TRINITY_DN14837_c0_g1_i1.p1 TRINITY_DN14837_c0_g1~~TRINITY_DN14837_c0_g1_i1.p1  ORF type:complete len:317 (+),score=30.93 TRINITY_DN14837_c0_g1_i1:706-1656(+)
MEEGKSVGQDSVMDALKRLHPHPRDERIDFVESTHTYLIDGSAEGWVGTTSALKAYFTEFDADAIIAKMRSNPNSKAMAKYENMSDEQIKESWEANGKQASEMGKRMHFMFETFCNKVALFDPVVDAAEIDKILDQPSAEAELVPEWTAFARFWREYFVPRGFRLCRTEFWIFYDGIAGSIDLLVRKPDGTFAIIDYKRCKALETFNTYRRFGKGVMSDVPDTNYGHYLAQQNVYRHILQQDYGVDGSPYWNDRMVVSELLLAVFPPSSGQYRIERLKMLPRQLMEGVFVDRCEQLANKRSASDECEDRPKKLKAV